ncbi:hypothetical protein THTE_1457 [Thermogutta terrifontis]|uniref:Uncharacterized protein n=1 Tax=Thermogutta terrifontis TaxID=1331910 RepID=A0A286RDM2_9BACT|nr:hypothetical protein THTE_1457 [Thermogutta terrifontis]
MSTPVRLSPEGPACQVRFRTFDYPFHLTKHENRSPVGANHELPLPRWGCHARRDIGHDERVPPQHLSEGPACQVHIPTFG